MNSIAAAVITGIGLLLALGGIACGARAYVLTVHEYDELPVWPRVHRQAERLRGLIRGRHREHTAAVSLSSKAGGVATATAGSGTLTVGQADDTLDERVERLQNRIEQVAQMAIVESSRATVAEDKLAQRIEEHRAELTEVDDQLRNLATAVAVDTARLQISGLVLVGFGTVLMAVPAVVAAFA